MPNTAHLRNYVQDKENAKGNPKGTVYTRRKQQTNRPTSQLNQFRLLDGSPRKYPAELGKLEIRK